MSVAAHHYSVFGGKGKQHSPVKRKIHAYSSVFFLASSSLRKAITSQKRIFFFRIFECMIENNKAAKNHSTLLKNNNSITFLLTRMETENSCFGLVKQKVDRMSVVCHQLRSLLLLKCKKGEPSPEKNIHWGLWHLCLSRASHDKASEGKASHEEGLDSTSTTNLHTSPHSTCHLKTPPQGHLPYGVCQVSRQLRKSFNNSTTKEEREKSSYTHSHSMYPLRAHRWRVRASPSRRVNTLTF